MAEYIELKAVSADCCDEVSKIKTPFARIIVEGTADKPYYSILWWDTAEKECNIGYSSYYLEYVFTWLKEEFEITEEDADVALVRHGRWISLTECANEGVYCSICKKKVWKSDYALCRNKSRNKLRSGYCPNCGAKMDLE